MKMLFCDLPRAPEPVEPKPGHADLRDPSDPQGRSYRKVNAEKTHAIPIGALVELESGARLFVVHHTRDCDETPLYCTSYRKDDTEQLQPGLKNPKWTGGYDEDGLKVIRLP